MGLSIKKDKDSSSQMACGYSSTALCNKMGSVPSGRHSQREITQLVLKKKQKKKSGRVEG